jgi:hypothetical protein
MSPLRKPMLAALFAAALCAAPASPAGAASPSGQGFDDPDRAAAALAAASRSDDVGALIALFGPEGADIVQSGDPIADRTARAHFAARYDQAHRIVADADDKATLVVGAEAWPFPIPLLRRDGQWRFDTAAGRQEILDRRVGRNELHAIEVCRAYVEAQRDFAALRKQHRLPVEYARKFVSSPGKKDGLYWPARAGAEQSPIGEAMARARAEGYGQKKSAQGSEPYKGYFYRILYRQSAHAPGGARDYVEHGRMTKGFALLAFPAKYGDSGIMTFMVDQDGVVFEKDLGPDTARLAAAIDAFDPDPGWKLP